MFLYTLAKKLSGSQRRLLHVPLIPSQVVNRPSVPFMNLEDIAKGIEAAIAAIGENENDILTAEGATHLKNIPVGSANVGVYLQRHITPPCIL